MTLLSLAMLFVHSFTGLVLDVREVRLVANTRAQVALVQGDFGKTWVILRVEPGPITSEAVVLGEARVGDQVQVSITGSHVLPDQVDWSLCQPAASAYCQFGTAYEDAPLSLDWNIPLSPSNEFIRYGRNGPHYSTALFWSTVVTRMPRAADFDAGRNNPAPDAQEVFRVAWPSHARESHFVR